MRFAKNHGTAPVVLREAPKASTPWNSGPYSVNSVSGLLALHPIRHARSFTKPNAIAPLQEGEGEGQGKGLHWRVSPRPARLLLLATLGYVGGSMPGA